MGTVPLALLPVATLSFILVLIWRLRLFSTVDIAGRIFFVVGGLLLFLGAAWQWARISAGYRTWFVVTAYPVIDFSQFAVALIGLILMTAALVRRESGLLKRQDDLQLRERRLSSLENIQLGARHHQQLIEMMNLVLAELLLPLPGCGGAIFLINRTHRQLVLGSWRGLSKAETAALERLSLESSPLRQSLDLEDPTLSGPLATPSDGALAPLARFQSTMVLPLLSGLEKIGVIVLLSDQPERFDRSELRAVAPVADWLAEKIHSARLTRELTLARQEHEKSSADSQELLQRVAAAARSFGSIDPVVQFCRTMVGLIGSNQVTLCGLRDAGLMLHGGSEAQIDLSENYRTALIEAIDRRKPLVINQEAVDADGHSRIVRSSLLFPLPGEESIDALLLRREAGPFSADDRDLQRLALFAQFARIVLGQQALARRDLTRRIGLDAVLELLRAGDRVLAFDNDPAFLARHLGTLLPPGAAVITLVRQTDGSYMAQPISERPHFDVDEFLMAPGEGMFGQVAVTRQAQFAFGRRPCEAALAGLDQSNRHAVETLFGEEAQPDFIAACPIIRNDIAEGLLIVFMHDLSDTERAEWERLLTLAVVLYSFLQSFGSATRPAATPLTGDLLADHLSSAVNELNNHLSAALGTAELAARREDLTGDLRLQLLSIVEETARAAALVRESVAEQRTDQPTSAPADEAPLGLNQIIRGMLERLHISGDLYLAGGKAREIDLRTATFGPLPFAPERLTEFFEELLNRFAASSADDDVITVATYTKDAYAYLDLSRHRKNFPPVERVADFGQYTIADLALRNRPGDVFLRHVAQGVCYFAADRVTSSPAYLSFKFPLIEPDAVGRESSEGQGVKILAIDDQAVILDLIAAMCQSLGYAVVTAQSGEEGIRRATSGGYSVVLTDLAMPDMSGLEVARQIHKLYPEIPIILVTGWEANLDRSVLHPNGITEVLYKPFRIEQLTDVITAAVRARQQL
jgi:CheY-like chemotaxis protein